MVHRYVCVMYVGLSNTTCDLSYIISIKVCFPSFQPRMVNVYTETEGLLLTLYKNGWNASIQKGSRFGIRSIVAYC